jgi:hypothetical protein
MQDWKQRQLTGRTQKSKNPALGDSLRSNRPCIAENVRYATSGLCYCLLVKKQSQPVYYNYLWRIKDNTSLAPEISPLLPEGHI